MLMFQSELNRIMSDEVAFLSILVNEKDLIIRFLQKILAENG